MHMIDLGETSLDESQLMKSMIERSNLGRACGHDRRLGNDNTDNGQCIHVLSQVQLEPLRNRERTITSLKLCSLGSLSDPCSSYARAKA